MIQRSEEDSAVTPLPGYVPLMTREAFAAAVGLPIGVLVGQCERGYWPQVTIGKRVLINVEALRMHAIERGREFAL